MSRYVQPTCSRCRQDATSSKLFDTVVADCRQLITRRRPRLSTTPVNAAIRGVVVGDWTDTVTRCHWYVNDKQSTKTVAASRIDRLTRLAGWWSYSYSSARSVTRRSRTATERVWEGLAGTNFLTALRNILQQRVITHRLVNSLNLEW